MVLSGELRQPRRPRPTRPFVRHAAGVGPQIEIAEDEFAALIDTHRRRIGAKQTLLRERLTSDWTSLPTRALVVLRVAVDAALGFPSGGLP